MTPEQIEMLKRLKAPIDKYMGEMQTGDMYIQEGYASVDFYCAECKYEFGSELQFHQMVANGQILRIPPLCTPDGKRCLWGMITNVEWKLLVNRPTKEDGLQCRYSDNLKEIYADDPYTAVLKALCSQEGL